MTFHLITGCARSGTGYAAQLLSHHLGEEVGHERFYNPERLGPLEGHESSWLAAPHLPEILRGEQKVRVTHLVRHPVETIRSNYERMGLVPNGHRAAPYARYAIHHSTRLQNVASDVERTMRYWYYWNLMIEPYCHELVRLEDIADPANIVNPNPVIPENREAITWEALPDGMTKRLIYTMARSYGYEL